MKFHLIELVHKTLTSIVKPYMAEPKNVQEKFSCCERPVGEFDYRGYRLLNSYKQSVIRGAICHTAHQVVIKRITEKNGGIIPFDLADHFMLAQGVDIESRTDIAPSGEIDAGTETRARNPLLSLSGRWGLVGKAGIGNAIPTGGVQWDMFGEGARTIMFERDESLIDLLEPDQVERLKRIITEQAEASTDIQPIKAEHQGAG
ncbi:hypothetical protein [Superficieibacter sp. HKU1]|uniref:hypothetical protein n=1 Tax=Superficieibacter sp. HKU1 TaxID=3031919 RepID=UPI0023E0D756|nr:hypothetical protein [Superficieibacter sp. HKU1]WES67632.1 hypothetical protein P0H77_18785 [Superficieibacter sp. HKU1]